MSTLTHTPAEAAAQAAERAAAAKAARAPKTLTLAQVRAALPGALRKLHPRAQWRNPVMLIVWVGAVLTTALAVKAIETAHARPPSPALSAVSAASSTKAGASPNKFFTAISRPVSPFSFGDLLRPWRRASRNNLKVDAPVAAAA